LSTALAVPRGPARVPLGADLALALAGGALHTLPFVFTEAWALQLALVALLAWRCGAVRPRRAAAIGLAFGTAWLGAGTWWMYISLHRYGGLPAPLAGLAVLGLCAVLSLYLAGAMALYAHGAPRRPLADALRFAACWLLAELARGVLFTGFPWIASGYAHIDGPLAALAPWVGVYGMGFAAAFIGALLVPRRPVWHSGRRSLAPPLAALALLVLLGIAGPGRFTRPTGTLAVTLLQTDVAQDEKFSLERMPQTLAWLSERLLAAKGALVVAPETAIPLLPEQLEPAYWEPLVQRFTSGMQAALIGLPLGSFERGYTNSVVGLSREAAAGKASHGASEEGLPPGSYRYDKHHLVPFGEFVPNGFHWFTEMMNIPLGDFSRGPLAAPSFAVQGQRIAPNICYEDLFGEELAARFADAAAAPTIFANISNIGWFGDTVAIPQHLNISRLRTLEFQRPMLRATNTGATAVIDHEGRVTAELRPFTQGVLETAVQGRDGLTPYARWCAALGLAPLLALGVLIVALTRRTHGPT
jgi:apolipoprotein N-acyltransferase